MRKIKVKIKALLRFAGDICTGTYFKFPGRASNFSFSHTIQLQQDIKPSQTFDNKVYNLKLASEIINEYIILPDQIFSFWNSVGNPEARFKKGRSIINGRITEETGGGLCQVSGLIYYAALHSGMEILERHNHSVDIYDDETRFTPLGTDATIVYGYKDLRLRNNFNFPVRFYIEIGENTINIQLQSTAELQKKALTFLNEETDNYVSIIIRDENHAILSYSKYRKIAEA